MHTSLSLSKRSKMEIMLLNVHVALCVSILYYANVQGSFDLGSSSRPSVVTRALDLCRITNRVTDQLTTNRQREAHRDVIPVTLEPFFACAINVLVISPAGASPEFEGRGGDDVSNTISHTLAQVYDHSSALDLPSLCIVPDQQCWILFVDAVVYT